MKEPEMTKATATASKRIFLLMLSIDRQHKFERNTEVMLHHVWERGTGFQSNKRYISTWQHPELATLQRHNVTLLCQLGAPPLHFPDFSDLVLLSSVLRASRVNMTTAALVKHHFDFRLPKSGILCPLKSLILTLPWCH